MKKFRFACRSKSVQRFSSGRPGKNASRREFLRVAGSAGLAFAANPWRTFADHHGHPSPNSISYLDRRMYIRNMELLAHVPGERRNGKKENQVVRDNAVLVSRDC